MRGFEAVHAQRVGELTAMVEVMLDHVPDDPPAGVRRASASCMTCQVDSNPLTSSLAVRGGLSGASQ